MTERNTKEQKRTERNNIFSAFFLFQQEPEVRGMKPLAGTKEVFRK
jgi:hypothetical protein